ncbi:capsular biosynthesis protein [Vibrio sp. CK2-1]|uniref:capsular biosynthesis protein n=1 Tax=Vibrio sp. CK2-1 TaxID=2912249 RepID=UPI001F19195C|nr:capsular biosynthesis protein [Vibrio sp. CK2-1]MCF7353048.1 capsular biosynthesis protein [Vibrio sp. CK2-1]
MNTGLFFQVYVFITLVFSGTAQYFTEVQAFLWLPFIMTMGMVALLPLLTRYNFKQLDHVEISILVLFLGFFCLALIPSVIQVGIKATIVGIKNGIGISLLLPCLFLGFCRESQLYRICQKLYWVFYAQIPLVLYQFIVVVPARVAAQGPMDKFDSVVGTFGGSMSAGGNGASMGLFCLLVMLMKVSEFKNGATTLFSATAHVVIGLSICTLAEVKFAILLAPIFFLVVYVSSSYIKEVRVISTKTILFLFLGAVILLLIIIVVSSLTYATQYQANMGVFEMFLDSTKYIFDPTLVVAGLDGNLDELGRLTALYFWGQHSDAHGLASQLFGYGLNSSNAGGADPGFLARHFNLGLGSTAIAIFLWEIGLIGTALLMLMVYLIFKYSKPQPYFSAKDLSLADMKLLSYQSAFRAFIIVGFITLPYSPLLALIPVFQFQFYFALGAILIIRKATLTKLETYYA